MCLSIELFFVTFRIPLTAMSGTRFSHQVNYYVVIRLTMLLLDSQWGKRVCKGSLDPLLIPSSHAKFSLLAKQWKRVGRKCIIIAWSLPNIFSEINHRRKKGMCVPIIFLLMTVLPRIAMVWMSVIECALFASERSSRQLSAILSIRPT